MKKIILVPFLLILFLLSQEKEEFDVRELSYLKVHEGGRVKPLDSYAEKILLIINGKTSFNNQRAINWLAMAMFTPEKVLDDRILKTTFKEVLFALDITPHKSRRYSFNELSNSANTLFSMAANILKKEDDEQSSFDKEVIRLYQNFLLYRQVLNSFVFVIPIDRFLINNKEVKDLLNLNSERTTFSYFELFSRKDPFLKLVNEISKKPPNTLKAKEIILLKLKEDFIKFPQGFLQHPLKLFPTLIKGEEKWFSAWEIFSIHNLFENENPIYEKLSYLNNLVLAYNLKDQKNFNKNLDDFNHFINQDMAKNEILKSKASRSDLEVFYNKLDPFYRATIFYGLSLLIIFLYFLLNKNWLKKIAGIFLTIGWLFNTLGIIIRMFITHRPPITNLFETFIFVAFIIVFLCFFLEKYNKKGMGILSASLSALTLLLISNGFVSNDGDTLNILVAVLRSNFWLSTHVITINLGYGGVALSGVIAHLYLFKLLKKNTDPADNKNIIRMVYATQAFGIIFTFLGTILGGVWADQSWGRFWGWDPKENGALLMVLWSAIIFHARFGGIIRDLGFAIGAIIGVPVLMLAWFGINLLGIGLHSYGFISGVAYNLLAYVILQFLLLLIVLYIIESKKQKKQLTKKG